MFDANNESLILRRSGFTLGMSSSLEHERYSAALPVVRKRKIVSHGYPALKLIWI
jgi:hypothetical protein